MKPVGSRGGSGETQRTAHLRGAAEEMGGGAVFRLAGEVPPALEELRTKAQYQPANGGSRLRNANPEEIVNRFLEQHCYVGNLYLSEVAEGRSDDSIPICLTYDAELSSLFVGMFQSLRGICRIDELGGEILANLPFPPNSRNIHFCWADPLSQALYGDKLLSVNRNNR